MTFTPHQFATRFNSPVVPKILISGRALRDMWYITDLVASEVAWFCTVKALDNNEYLIEDCYVPRQECSGTTAELTVDGQDELIRRLLEEDEAAGVENVEDYRVNRLQAWFHSHVNMDTSPSGQDLEQAMGFGMGRTHPWYIRGIVNKKGRMSIAFYDFKSSFGPVYFEDCPWEPADDDEPDPRRTHWQQVVRESVKGLGSGGRPAGSWYPAGAFGGSVYGA